MKRKTASITRQELLDTEDERGVGGRLGYFLKLCGVELWPRFSEEDRHAIDFQDDHRNLTRFVVACGTLALLVACAQLAWRESSILTVAEGTLALLAGAGVVWGYLKKFHRSWLGARYRAERFCLLKFRSFADPKIWSEDTGSSEWENAFLSELKEIQEIEDDELESIAHRDPLPDIPSEQAAGRVPDSTRRSLAVYYRIKRLEPQIAYFQRRAHQVRIAENPVLLPFIFFLSITFVSLHSAVELVLFLIERTRERALMERALVERLLVGAKSLATILVALSLALPALWAGFRTYRSANEFARNRSRSLARENSLREIEQRLREDEKGTKFFANVALGESILAADQHEWLRLMLEAEWYG